MPLIGTTEMFKKAYEGHYAIGASTTVPILKPAKIVLTAALRPL